MHSCHREAHRRLLHSTETPGEIILHENSMCDIVTLPHGKCNILFLSEIVATMNTCWCAHTCTSTHLAESQMKSCRSLRLSAEHAEVYTSDTEGLHSNATSPTTMTWGNNWLYIRKRLQFHSFLIRYVGTCSVHCPVPWFGCALLSSIVIPQHYTCYCIHICLHNIQLRQHIIAHSARQILNIPLSPCRRYRIIR